MDKGDKILEPRSGTAECSCPSWHSTHHRPSIGSASCSNDSEKSQRASVTSSTSMRSHSQAWTSSRTSSLRQLQAIESPFSMHILRNTWAPRQLPLDRFPHRLSRPSIVPPCSGITRFFLASVSCWMPADSPSTVSTTINRENSGDWRRSSYRIWGRTGGRRRGSCVDREVRMWSGGGCGFDDACWHDDHWGARSRVFHKGHQA